MTGEQLHDSIIIWSRLAGACCHVPVYWALVSMICCYPPASATADLPLCVVCRSQKMELKLERTNAAHRQELQAREAERKSLTRQVRFLDHAE